MESIALSCSFSLFWCFRPLKIMSLYLFLSPNYPKILLLLTYKSPSVHNWNFFFLFSFSSSWVNSSWHILRFWIINLAHVLNIFFKFAQSFVIIGFLNSILFSCRRNWFWLHVSMTISLRRSHIKFVLRKLDSCLLHISW